MHADWPIKGQVFQQVCCKFFPIQNTAVLSKLLSGWQYSVKVENKENRPGRDLAATLAATLAAILAAILAAQIGFLPTEYQIVRGARHSQRVSGAGSASRSKL